MSPTDTQEARVLAALRIFCLAFIGLHLVGPYLPEEHAWGLWPFAYLPPIWRWLLAALAALACVPPVADGVVRSAATAVRNLQARLPRQASRNTVFATVALLSLIPFTLFHIAHTRWGDAYILVNGIAYPDPALRLTGTWQAPLDVWLHVRLWALGHRLWGWTDAWPAYRILSPLAGALYVYVLLRLADSTGRSRAEKSVIVGLVGTLGTMQLFFGYAENYTLAAVGVLLFLWLSLDCAAGRRALWQPALALAVTNGLHPSTIVLDPALLFVGWVWGKRRQVDKETGEQGNKDAVGEGSKVWWVALAQIALPMIAVAAGVVVLMTLSGHGLDTLATTDRPGGGDARWFVPLTTVTTRWEHYTMFSWPHLRDWLNEQLLTAPVTLGGLLIVAASFVGQQRSISGMPESRDPTSTIAQSANLPIPKAEITFLILCTGLYWLFTWVWNPDYGGQRDWDLFSLAAIPSTLLLARLLPRALRGRSRLLQAGVMLTAVSAMHTAVWIFQNTRPWEWT